MKNTISIDQPNTNEPLWINALGLALIGFTSLGYIFFKRDFAELHFQLPFFGGLPLFIGEMLWIACFALILAQLLICRRPTRSPLFVNDGMSWFWFGIVVYGIWLLSKVFFGLMNHSPLAFRHAALFYYPLFAVFGFLFFHRKLFSGEVILFLLGIIILTFAYRRYDLYWTLTLCSLAAILTLRLCSWQLRLLMGALLFLCVPYYAFFSTARMMIIANSCSLAILGTGLWKALPFKKTHKALILVFFVIGIVAVVFYSFFTRSRGRVFVAPKTIIEAYQSMDRDVQKGRKSYVKEPISTQLYRPEHLNNVARPFGKLKADKRFEQDKKALTSGFGSTVSKEKSSLEDARERDTYVKAISTNNIIFRLFIWRDMWREWCQNKPLWGFDFGHPLRSESLEILFWAGEEWGSLGWVEPHNSYFHIFYRSGFLGFVFIGAILGFAIWVLVNAFAMKSLSAIFLSAIIWNWMVAANFLITFEMPYTAIPFWTLFGMSVAYISDKKRLLSIRKGLN